MRQWLRSHLTYANVMATIAVFLALGGGGFAVASHLMVQSSDIVDNQVFSADVRNDTLSGGGLVAADLRPSSVGTSEVADGSIASGDLAPAARGARAYGRVSVGGTLTRSKNVASVTKPGAGLYCMTVTGGIDPASAVLVVGPDLAGSGTSTLFGGEKAPVVEWDSGGIGCPAGTLAVRTFLYDGDPVDNDSGVGNTTGDDFAADAEPFAFVVP
jgi:hypothetical protein